MPEENAQFVDIASNVSIRVKIDEFPANSNNYGLDIRRYVTSQNYAGPTKKGIWIPVENRNKEPIAIYVAQAVVHILAKHLGVSPENLTQRVLKFPVREGESFEPEK